MQDANAAYCIALAELMRSPRNGQSAFRRATGWAAAAANEEVRGFLAEAEAQDVPADFDCTDHQGYLRWAFVLAFRCVRNHTVTSVRGAPNCALSQLRQHDCGCRHLQQGSAYVAALQDTLSRGGDTDTNACIVGGMIGALHGVEAIPGHVRATVLGRHVGSPGNARPEFLQPTDLLNRIRRLHAP